MFVLPIMGFNIKFKPKDLNLLLNKTRTYGTGTGPAN